MSPDGKTTGTSHSVVAGAISPTRLSPYLTVTGERSRDAIRLYQWNIELSGAMYELLHFFEVALRNAMDARLCEWNTRQTNRQTGDSYGRDWLMDPAPLLTRLTRGDIDTATTRAATASKYRKGSGRGRPVQHGDVLAQLSLGTWWFLLPSRNDAGRQLLWKEALEGSFPHLTRKPEYLVSAVEGVYRIRNRVAHLEPLLNTGDVRRQVTNVREVLGEIDPALEQWAMGWQRVTTMLSTRPNVEQP
ncbi:hypothetical protein [Oerskovia enterophila]|uniref:hypothetical protein n=1 Tax=Oerskovia enterophila TaxID=43678 RepID=UPI003398E6DB